jgi:hypothetical protein
VIRVNLLPVQEIQAEVGRRQDLAIAGVSVAGTLLLVLAVYLYQGHRLARLND